MTENVVSLSGGKDSTAMLLMMLDRGVRVDEAVFFDTGWEFPEMYEHLDRLERDTGIEITRLRPDVPFDELMLHNHRTRGKRKGVDYGYGWPSPLSRWCTTIKTQTIDKHLRGRDVVQYVGIAADEAHRCRGLRYPLVEWGVTEAEALSYCRGRGYDWRGLYGHFKRVSCWCCPLQPLKELKALREHHPDLWKRLMCLDFDVAHNSETQDRFRADYTVPQLEQRFRAEDSQMRLDFRD